MDIIGEILDDYNHESGNNNSNIVLRSQVGLQLWKYHEKLSDDDPSGWKRVADVQIQVIVSTIIFVCLLQLFVLAVVSYY
jgi:hypothetical protein